MTRFSAEVDDILSDQLRFYSRGFVFFSHRDYGNLELLFRSIYQSYDPEALHVYYRRPRQWSRTPLYRFAASSCSYLPGTTSDSHCVYGA